MVPQYDPNSFRPKTATQRAAQSGINQLNSAVQGYGEILRPELMQTIGSALGGLNQIGALRSGATVTALNDITTNYADRVGAYATQTAGQGAQLGLGQYDREMAERQRKREERASLLRTLGSALGAGIGFFTGGPAGAAAGFKAGQYLTGNGGGTA